MKTIIFDIETGPLPPEHLAKMIPPFDPGEVKTGNLKDPAKIAEKLKEAEANHVSDFIERAALDATTGRVLAIGCLVFHGMQPCRTLNRASGEVLILGLNCEAFLVEEFWKLITNSYTGLNLCIGFNSLAFDLPFLIRRSWALGVQVPTILRNRRFWHDNLIDIRDWWKLGDYQAKGSLDTISKHLGYAGKNGDGKNFHKLWESDRLMAEAYLRNDLFMTLSVASRLNVSL